MTLLRSNWHLGSSAIRPNPPPLRLIPGPTYAHRFAIPQALPPFILLPPTYFSRRAHQPHPRGHRNPLALACLQTRISLCSITECQLIGRMLFAQVPETTVCSRE